MTKVLALIALAVVLVNPLAGRCAQNNQPADADSAAAKQSTSESSGAAVSGTKPLDVRGQTRMQALIKTQDEKSEINFVKVRKDYRDEILKTPY